VDVASRTPGLVAVSPLVTRLPADAPAALKEAAQCGYLTITTQEQLTKADHMFGCRAVLRAFLEECERPPLYFGWGPMVRGTPEAMARLAVGTAKACDRFAVVLCGGADLGPAWLQENAADAPLADYIGAGRVMFVRSAPLEWLFPRCAAVVHHGGVGTTACSLRAGVPTIVTPCCLEQIAQARLVADLGVGTGYDVSQTLTSEVLAKELQRLVADVTVREKCAQMSQALQKEEGMKIAVQHIDKFFTDQVATGRWKAANERRLKERAALQGVGCFSCFGWCGKVLGFGARNDFAP